MSTRVLLTNFIVTFVVGFLVTALTTWAWGLLFEGGGRMNWTLALILGLVIAIVTTVVNAIRGKQS